MTPEDLIANPTLLDRNYLLGWLLLGALTLVASVLVSGLRTSPRAEEEA